MSNIGKINYTIIKLKLIIISSDIINSSCNSNIFDS